MKSFSILRTNVGLTTNSKIMVNNEYGISIDSIDSNDTLSSGRYKYFKLKEDSLYDEVLPLYFKDTPSEIAFDVKYRDDSDAMSSDLNTQYDSIYNYGARNIINNKNYSEEYEYFAPLYINPRSLPSNFIIFRCDNPGVKILAKDNFKGEIINKLKAVKVYDFSSETPLGKWMNKNFVENEYFPKSPLEIDFRNTEFSKWNGIDYKRGGYVSKSKFMGDYFEEEKEIYELEKYIYDSYKDNGVVFPNILNMSFLFDDTPSTSTIKRKWSLNTYYGFYLDSMDRASSLSPYSTPIIREDVIIKEGNILFSASNPENPFIENWSEETPFYVEYGGDYYLISKYTIQQDDEIRQVQAVGFVDELYQDKIIYNYKIVSDIDLSGKEDSINKNYGIIDKDNKILSYNNEEFVIDNFDSSDVWVIKIGEVYHNIIKTSSVLKINTDYSFEINDNFFDYKVRGETKRLNTDVTFDKPPLSFGIFKLNFTDIKDFDTNIVDTDYSKYEYELRDEITRTEESKMYFEDPLSLNNPKNNEEFIYKNNVESIPVSSEYTANYETFKVTNNELSDIWRINPVYCRWGYQNSIGANDRPYLLNNSLLFEDHNRTANPFMKNQSRENRNLDYFYTINSNSNMYTHHSLHVEGFNSNNNIEKEFRFISSTYLNPDIDYFSEIFERKQFFDNKNIVRNVRKYSHMNAGDDVIPNSTVFRGLEFRMYDVDSVIRNGQEQIKTINTTNSNSFEDYKFSILLSNGNSSQVWDIITNWEMDKEYKEGNIVLFDDIVYKALRDNIIINPLLENGTRSAPYNNLSDWEALEDNTIFWNPVYGFGGFTPLNTPIFDTPGGSSSSIGAINGSPFLGSIISEPLPVTRNNLNIVYNSDRFYYTFNVNSTLVDFWNPLGKPGVVFGAQGTGNGYDLSTIVIFKGKYYRSKIKENKYRPDNKKYWEVINLSSDSAVKWKQAELWNTSLPYDINSIVVHNNKLYISSEDETTDIGDEPGVSILWLELYTFDSSNNMDDNYDIFLLNDNYYKIKSDNGVNSSDLLSNGINVYINKKWKNILVNIYINDATLTDINNVNRDDIYKDLYNVLTANNLSNSINNISDKNGFINYLRYTVIDEQGTVRDYDFDNNITRLPYLLTCELPDELQIKTDSLINKPLSYPNIKVRLALEGGSIRSVDMINWYNGTPLAYSITNNETESKVYKNYNGLSNIQNNTIYRYSGYYMPIFYDIDLFDKSNIRFNGGNYKFDTTLTNFGYMRERKFRKVNRGGSVLKLRDSKDNESIYPMIDEYGYAFKDFNIFKSTWDKEFHIESVSNVDRLKIDRRKDISVQNIGQPLGVKIENEKKYRL